MQVNRDQIREIVKEEFYKILFEEKIFETEIKAYIKSLIFEDIHGLRMIVKGKINNHKSELIVSEDELNFTLFEKKENIDIKKLYDQYFKGRFVECTYDTFFKALHFKTEIKAYIKSLIFEDIHGLRMIVKGKINNHKSELIVSEDELNFTLFEKKENIDIKKLYDQYFKGRFVECTYDTFFKALHF